MQFQPMPLRRRPDAFDHPDWLFELKYDGFRALAIIEDGTCRLVSRNGNVFASFQALSDALGRSRMASRAILDGELVCVDERGHPRFDDLLYHRREPAFFAFDLLHYDEDDLRDLPLIKRKARLERLVRGRRDRLLYVNHIVGEGKWLFQKACELDLEGVVAKQQDGRYVGEREQSTWWKVRNPNYTQIIGREDQFERLERPHEPEQAGWASCVVACRAAHGLRLAARDYAFGLHT
jgi:bifunctional non-homologous end joining protein LigD